MRYRFILVFVLGGTNSVQCTSNENIRILFQSHYKSVVRFALKLLYNSEYNNDES